MINYDSILSAFDGKPTLLQWLKLVKKALDESVLKDITVSQDGASAVFTFNFEDGTSISTPAVTLPKGNTGAKGDKGDKGEQGVSVTGVDEVSNEVVGSQTLTTLRFNFSNGTNNEVVVHAENGSSGNLFLHSIKIEDSGKFYSVMFNAYSTKRTLTLEDALALIGTNGMPASFQYMDQRGVLSVEKYKSGEENVISGIGVLYNRVDDAPIAANYTFTPELILDTLEGENL